MDKDTVEFTSPPPSSSTTPLCAICNTAPSKYTCPRCSAKSCSLPCSKAHKAQTGCSGERDRTAFIPMNQYDYSALVNDYSFLEDVGRKVEGWGRDIAKNGIARKDVSSAVRGTSMRGGRGRGGRGKRVMGHGQERRRFLAMQLALRDVDMDILPSGMERAQRNRSSWDSKGKKAMMTVEFIFKPPPDPYTRQIAKVEPLMAHKLDWTMSVRDILRSILKNSSLKKNESFIHWLSLEEVDNDVQSSILCLMKKPKDPSEPYNQASYYKLDWNLSLSKLLRHKQITEFPSIEIIDESVFEGCLIDDDGIVEDTSHKAVKRRRLDEVSGKKAIATLVGGYGSDESASGDEDEPIAVMDTLAEYAGSGDEGPDGSGEDDDIDAEGETDEEYEEMMRAALSKAQEDVDDATDWGDDMIAEDEAKIASLSAALQQRALS